MQLRALTTLQRRCLAFAANGTRLMRWDATQPTEVPRCFRWVRTVERNPKGCQTVAGGRVCETPGDSVNSSSTLEGCQKSGRSNRNAPVWHPYGVLSLAGRSGGLADSTSGYALSTLRVESIHRMPTENSEEPETPRGACRVLRVGRRRLQSVRKFRVNVIGGQLPFPPKMAAALVGSP